MAEKDIIARLKVEGQVDFINSMNQSADAVGKTTKSIDGLDGAVEELGDTFDNTDKAIALMAKEMDELTTELIKAIKSGKGVNEAVKKLETSIDNASESIVKMSKDSSDAFKLTSKLEDAFNEARKGSDKLTKGIDGTSDSLENIMKFLGTFDKNVDETTIDLYNLGASFEDIYGTLKPLTSRLGEMEDRMYELALAGKQNTDEFKALNAEAIRFRKTQIEVDKAVDALADSGAGIRAVSEGISGLAGAFAVGQGAIALFGDENESLEKALIKLNAVMAISSGIQQVNENLLQKNAFTTKALTVAQNLYGRAVAFATAQTKAFQIALVGLGIGALVGLIALLATNWDKVTRALGLSKDSQDELNKSIEQSNKLRDLQNSLFDVELRLKKALGATDKELIQLQLVRARAQLAEAKGQLDLIKGAESFTKELELQKKQQQATYGGGEIQDFSETVEALQNQMGVTTTTQEEMSEGVLEATIKFKQAQAVVAELEKSLNESAKSTSNQKKEVEFLVGSLVRMNVELQKAQKMQDESVVGSDQWKQAVKDVDRIKLEIEQAEMALAQFRFEMNKTTQSLLTFETTVSYLPTAAKDAVNNTIMEMIRIESEAKERLRLSRRTQIQELEELRDEEIRIAREKGARIHDIEKFYNDQIRELRRQEITEQLDQTANLASQAFNIFAQFNNAQKIALENRLKQGLVSEEQYNKEVAKLNEKQAKADKAKALFDATINGASAIISAYRIGLPFAIVVGALVAAQIAAIAATPIPKFFKGVIGLQRGNNPKGRDTIPAMLNEGESVMTTDETKQHRPVLEAIRNKTFDKMYIRRGKMEQRTLSSIVNFSGSKKNKKLEKKMDMIYYQLENINSNTNMGASGTRQLNKYFKKRKNGSEFFV